MIFVFPACVCGLLDLLKCLCFFKTERNNINLDREGGGEKQERENHDQNVLYENNFQQKRK